MILFDCSNQSINYINRTSTAGDEFNMVNKYVNHIKKWSEGLSKKQIAVFLEPQLESGYPDIVIVEFYNPSIDLWCESRSKLKSIDLKILVHIINTSSYSIGIKKISESLGYDENQVKKSIKLLAECQLIYYSKSHNYVRKKDVKRWSGITRIIAIEAKMNKWKQAMEQAGRNIWFCTDSYVLLNKEKCSEEVYNTCKKNGVGIILSNRRIFTPLKSAHRKYPISYASLQFNEWIQNYLHGKENV